MHVEATPVDMNKALKRTADEYDDVASYCVRVVLDYFLSLPKTDTNNSIDV